MLQQYLGEARQRSGIQPRSSAVTTHKSSLIFTKASLYVLEYVSALLMEMKSRLLPLPALLGANAFG